MSKSKRTTKVEKERRILAVQGWIIDGVHDNLIIRQIKEKWELSRRQAERYLKQAYGNWREDELIGIEDKRAATIARLKKKMRDLDPKYRITPKGLNSLGGIEKMIIRLEGTERPMRHHIEGEMKTEIKPTRYIDATKDE